MSNPLIEVDAFLEADLSNLPANATHSAAFPASNLDHIHVQVAWDGTPSDADNRENTAIRVTVWAPRGHVTDPQDVAAGLRARLLAWSSAAVWRVDRGAGRLPGIDPDTKLPFCSFTVNVALRAVTA
jgi:hypothetical protein